MKLGVEWKGKMSLRTYYGSGRARNERNRSRQMGHVFTNVETQRRDRLWFSDTDTKNRGK